MKSRKTIAGISFAAVLSVAAFGAFTITAGGENNEPSVLYEEPTATVLSTEAETTTEGTEVLEAESEIVSASVVKLSVNNAKVYSANAATAPNEIGGDENLADEMAENAAYAAEKELTAAETTTSAIVVGETLETTTAVAQATAKYVVSENNDIVKSVVSCGFPNQNFGLSDKEAKSITYAAIQYLCEGTEYTGEHVEEFNALVRAAQTYNGPFKLDGVTIIVR